MLLLLLSLVLLFGGLGIWQLHRLTWKQSLIATVDARIHAEPTAIPDPSDWADLDVEELVYQPVRLQGVLDHDSEVQSLAVTEFGSGYWVMTPLQLDGDGIVLINRGFVTSSMRDPATRSSTPTEGKVEIIGLLRASEPEGGFLRANDPEADRWYSRDVAAIAKAKQLEGPVAPFLVDAGIYQDLSTGVQGELADQLADQLADGIPLAGLTVVTFRNTHLVYALTWFALAILGVVGVVLLLKEWGKEGKSL